MDQELEVWARRVYNIHPDVEAKALHTHYHQYSSTYDTALGSFEYFRALQEFAERFQSLYAENKDIRILDIGAGTGVLGLELQKLGFTNIDALDLDRYLLNVAEEKKIYSNIIHDQLNGHPLDIEDNTYDAIIGSGLFVLGRATHICFEELLRLTKPGGHVCLMVGEKWLKALDVYKNFEPAMTSLADRGQWELVAKETQDYTWLTKAIRYILKVTKPEKSAPKE